MQINAYLIGKNGIIVRDQRLVLVDPANDLHIEVQSNQDSYLPGTEAKLRVMIEGQDKYEITTWANEICDLVKKHIGER